MTPSPSCPLAKADKRAALIKVGKRLIRRMVMDILTSHALKTAVKMDPRQALAGPRHTVIRARIRLIKRLLRVWLWIQIPQVSQINYPDTNGTGRQNCAAKESPSEHAGQTRYIPAQIPEKTIPHTPSRHEDKLAATLYAAGYRAKVRLWDARQSARKPAIKPPPAVPTIKVQMLPEAQAWVFGNQSFIPTPTPLTNLGLVLAPKGAIRAGQAYIDLMKIADILDQPDNALAQIAGKITGVNAIAKPHRRASGTLYGETSEKHIYARAEKPPAKRSKRPARPVLPTQQNFKTSDIDGDLPDWVQALTLLLPPLLPPHPPPESATVDPRHSRLHNFR